VGEEDEEAVVVGDRFDFVLIGGDRLRGGRDELFGVCIRGNSSGVGGIVCRRKARRRAGVSKFGLKNSSSSSSSPGKRGGSSSLSSDTSPERRLRSRRIIVSGLSSITNTQKVEWVIYKKKPKNGKKWQKQKDF
jgi:hypothetical protein